MQEERIEQLLNLIPRDASHLRHIPRQLSLEMSVPVEADWLSYALNKPDFGWFFVKVFLDLERELPKSVYEPELLRTFCACYHQYPDRDVIRCIGLNTEADKQRRWRLKCLLLLEKFELSDIAELCCLSVDVVRIYAALYWNIRDRLHDKSYIGSILFPESRQVEWLPHYNQLEVPESLLLRGVWQHGEKVVDDMLGVTNPVQDFDADQAARTFEARVMHGGVFATQMGFLNQRMPLMDNARTILQSIKLGGDVSKSSDYAMGAGALSLSSGAHETFMRIAGPDMQHRLQLQQSFYAAEERQKEKALVK